MDAQVGVYVIGRIKDSRRALDGSDTTEYHVEWVGYKGQDTWEPVANIQGRGDQAIRDFLQKEVGRVVAPKRTRGQ